MPSDAQRLTNIMHCWAELVVLVVKHILFYAVSLRVGARVVKNVLTKDYTHCRLQRTGR